MAQSKKIKNKTAVKGSRNLTRENCLLHGVAIVVFGKGILLTGKALAGKSECAAELLRRGHQFIADDLVLVTKLSGHLCLTAPKALEKFMHLRGIGIIDVTKIFGKKSLCKKHRLNLVIHFDRHHEINDPFEFKKKTTFINKIAVPRIDLNTNNQTSVATLVEIAAKHFKLKTKVDQAFLVQVLDSRLNPSTKKYKILQSMKSPDASSRK